MRPPRFIRRRRVDACMTVKVPDRAPRRRGSGAGQPPAHSRPGGRRPAHLQVVGAAPYAAVPPRGGVRGKRPRHGVTAGSAPQAEPAARTPHMGMFDCRTCGYPIGRGHADDCPNQRPARTVADWGELTVCLLGFGALAGLALWLRAPQVAAAFVVLAVVAWIAYKPPARGQVRRSQPPLAPAPRAPAPLAGRDAVRPSSGGARPFRRRAQARPFRRRAQGRLTERKARMGRTPLGPAGGPTQT